MPQFPFTITFSAAEMCAKFTGPGAAHNHILLPLKEVKESINFFFIIMKACQIKLISTHTRGLFFQSDKVRFLLRKSVVARGNFSQAHSVYSGTPGGGNAINQYDTLLRSFAHMSHAWSTRQGVKGTR